MFKPHTSVLCFHYYFPLIIFIKQQVLISNLNTESYFQAGLSVFSAFPLTIIQLVSI